MIKDQLHQPYELVLKEYMEVCPRGLHTHTFFELIYIVDGTGVQCINDSEVAYTSGNLFLIAPNDSHIFRIEKTSRFFFIRFNKGFAKVSKTDAELVQHIELILQNVKNEPGCLLNNDADKVAMKQLMEILIREHIEGNTYGKELIGQLINTLLIIIARNVTPLTHPHINENTEERALDILHYIHSNIYYPDKLRIQAISTHFGIAETYIGRYFKNHVQETLQQYILTYKLKLVENRLLNTHMRISEIADEFGFTDKSHLNRIFKKYREMNPSDFRKSHLHS